ncbi:unnamed protein product [Dovyalis caffra]|uniref:Uncharacterized protein n=1 Tax=Dovyalis caffra TaxID=77055 RepID=A0AAV1R8S2_9ROSI|nr:unnamed protein product [Dovyalis caffra]
MPLSLPAPSALSQLTKNHRNLPLNPDFPSEIALRIFRPIGIPVRETASIDKAERPWLRFDDTRGKFCQSLSPSQFILLQLFLSLVVDPIPMKGVASEKVMTFGVAVDRGKTSLRRSLLQSVASCLPSPDLLLLFPNASTSKSVAENTPEESMPPVSEVRNLSDLHINPQVFSPLVRLVPSFVLCPATRSMKMERAVSKVAEMKVGIKTTYKRIYHLLPHLLIQLQKRVRYGLSDELLTLALPRRPTADSQAADSGHGDPISDSPVPRKR